jgi:hypothetical protein
MSQGDMPGTGASPWTIGRLDHYDEILALKGDSYQLRDKKPCLAGDRCRYRIEASLTQTHRLPRP